MQLIMLFLTCAHKTEAEKISKALIEQKLIACSKMIPIHAMFQWEGNVQGEDETMLIMETSQEFCHSIEETIRPLHSYKTFVLTGIPVAYVSEKAREWLKETLKK
jgi:periplasmic divalent cation tolerance protein